MRHFSILDFEDAEEFGFQRKWAALCKQMGQEWSSYQENEESIFSP